VRNVDPATYDPATAGFTQFGDPSGSKRGTLQTYLRDAYDAGARILARTRADRVTVEDGRATGVVATYAGPDGGTRSLEVRATEVVVACGALETPALLLRSGIGGPAVGHHLHLHPSAGIFGVYAEDQQAWWGPPQAAVMDEFRDLGDGYGLLVEGSQYYSGVFAFQLARRDGRDAKEAMSKLGRMADFLFVLRDHGAGQVTVDDAGEAVHTYALTDERDVAAYRLGLRVMARLHEAAGAEELWFGTTPRVWRRGEDLEAWVDELDQVHIGANGLFMGSAHQMGSARMGTDPATSVARPTGELHDVDGVWIGDTSAFPTASGANPMLTCMALAHRTAEIIGGARDEVPAAVRPAAETALDDAPAA
jgi:choline dehydrogenase-like flavoprotein